MSKAPMFETNALDTDEMLPEYDFDYGQARPNRFAPRIEEGSLIVVLDPDIARVFRTPDAVKDALRAVMATMPVASEDE